MATSQTSCHLPSEMVNSPAKCTDRARIGMLMDPCLMARTMGRAHTTEENGKWGETKQRSENQVAFNSVLGPS
jgi:hypothetical protein